MRVTLAAMRDVSIILVALESIFIGIMLTVLVVQLARLTKMLREEVLPVLTSAQDTASTVRGTTTFVSDRGAARRRGGERLVRCGGTWRSVTSIDL
jgi:hypothetical protein